MNYEVSASTFAPIAKVHLQKGEKLRIEPGAMVYQLGQIELEGKMNTNGKKGLGGALSALGRSVTSERRTGELSDEASKTIWCPIGRNRRLVCHGNYWQRPDSCFCLWRHRKD